MILQIKKIAEMLLRALIYVSILAAMFVIALHIDKHVLDKRVRQYFFEHVSALGNDLSSYFYFTNTNFTVDTCWFLKEYGKSIVDQQLKYLYLNFNCKKNDTIVDYKSERHSTWNQYNFAGQQKSNYMQYWKNVRPFMQKFYKSIIDEEISVKPVVHFRCSDSPFYKHVEYHLTKAESVKWMAQQIKNRGFNAITILSCNNYRSLDNGSCIKYTNFYAGIFRQSGLDVTIQCNTVYKDFALMVNAPLLVSLNSSSFSFMAGVAKNPQDFISCNMGIELNGKYLLQNTVDWVLDNRGPLLHAEVLDYNDTDTVIAKLNR